MIKPVQYIFFVSLLLYSSVLTAQQTDWSEPQKVKDKIIYSEVIGANNGNYYIIRYNKKSKQQFIIEKYDKTLRLAKKLEFEVAKNISVEKILLLHGKIFIFSVTYNSELKKTQLFVNVFNDNFTAIIKDQTLIASDFKYSNRKNFYISKDMINNRILIVYPENTKNNSILYKLSILNTDLQKLYSNSFVIDTEKNYQIDQYQLIDSTIAIVYKTYKGNSDDPTNERFYLIDFDLMRNKQTQYKFADDTIFFNNLLIKYDIPNRTLICSGYFSYLGSENNAGIAYLKLFKNTDSAIYRSIRFPDELKNSILGKNNKKEKINSYYPKGIIVRDDGGFLFIGEYYKVQKEVYTNYSSTSNMYDVKYYYNYGNAMLLSIDPNGKIDWQKVIRKDQVSMSDDGAFSSLSVATTDIKVALLYNDISRTRTNLIFNAVEPNNTINNYIIVNGNSFNGSLIPKLSKQVGANEIIVPGFENKKGFLFLRIKI